MATKIPRSYVDETYFKNTYRYDKTKDFENDKNILIKNLERASRRVNVLSGGSINTKILTGDIDLAIDDNTTLTIKDVTCEYTEFLIESNGAYQSGSASTGLGDNTFNESVDYEKNRLDLENSIKEALAIVGLTDAVIGGDVDVAYDDNDVNVGTPTIIDGQDRFITTKQYKVHHANNVKGGTGIKVIGDEATGNVVIELKKGAIDDIKDIDVWTSTGTTSLETLKGQMGDDSTLATRLWIENFAKAIAKTKLNNKFSPTFDGHILAIDANGDVVPIKPPNGTHPISGDVKVESIWFYSPDALLTSQNYLLSRQANDKKIFNIDPTKFYNVSLYHNGAKMVSSDNNQYFNDYEIKYVNNEIKIVLNRAFPKDTLFTIENIVGTTTHHNPVNGLTKKDEDQIASNKQDILKNQNDISQNTQDITSTKTAQNTTTRNLNTLKAKLASDYYEKNSIDTKLVEAQKKALKTATFSKKNAAKFLYVKADGTLGFIQIFKNNSKLLIANIDNANVADIGFGYTGNQNYGRQGGNVFLGMQAKGVYVGALSGEVHLGSQDFVSILPNVPDATHDNFKMYSGPGKQATFLSIIHAANDYENGVIGIDKLDLDGSNFKVDKIHAGKFLQITQDGKLTFALAPSTTKTNSTSKFGDGSYTTDQNGAGYSKAEIAHLLMSKSDNAITIQLQSDVFHISSKQTGMLQDISSMQKNVLFLLSKQAIMQNNKVDVNLDNLRMPDFKRKLQEAGVTTTAPVTIWTEQVSPYQKIMAITSSSGEVTGEVSWGTSSDNPFFKLEALGKKKGSLEISMIEVAGKVLPVLSYVLNGVKNDIRVNDLVHADLTNSKSGDFVIVDKKNPRGFRTTKHEIKMLSAHQESEVSITNDNNTPTFLSKDSGGGAWIFSGSELTLQDPGGNNLGVYLPSELNKIFKAVQDGGKQIGDTLVWNGTRYHNDNSLTTMKAEIEALKEEIIKLKKGSK